MGIAGDAPHRRMRRIERERGGRLHRAGSGIRVGEHEARHPIGERRLADAGLAADQPGMGDAAAAIARQQRLFGGLMAEQHRGLPRQRSVGVNVIVAFR